MSGPPLWTVEFGTSDGRPLVGLHGGRTTGQTWARMADEGLPRRRWICPDLRGHGNSPKESPYTVEQLANDVLATLDQLNVERFDVIGHSIGARTAVEIARLAPTRVGRLVLLDPPAMTPAQFQALASRDPAPHPWEAASLDDALGALRDAPPNVKAYAQREILAATEPGDGGGLRLRSDQPGIADVIEDIGRNLPYSFGDFRGEVLLVTPQVAYAVTDQGLDALRSELEDRLTHVTIAGSGHMLLWDAFEEVVAELAKFFVETDR